MLTLLACGVATPLAGQHSAAAHNSAMRIDMRGGIHAVGLVTHASPILNGESKTEAYLTQPTLLGGLSAFDGALSLTTSISLEGLTLDRGELGAGSYGEGYVDRRHPHTYLHELVVSAQRSIGPAAVSLAAGRGFAPFGTDDPMMRPFVKFPVNHHLAQVLERLIAQAGVRTQHVMVEAGVFSGNEPLDAADMGSIDRFGDSWAARVTIRPLNGIELQASHARIESPELPSGDGWDQRKWGAAARYSREHAFGRVYALAEWKHTTEVDRGADLFGLSSVLMEGALDIGGWRPAVRYEWSERPEEQRGSDPFRTPWPHAGGHVLGITRWNIVSARIERAAEAAGVRMAPFVEASHARVSETAGGVFDPEEFYGATRLWTLNIGIRFGAGMHPTRMGRYGVAADAAQHQH